ncbi:MAG TPA: SIMPL domain-containing protein [Vicinamibacterales bacterium]|nr:SIMPL domain-containing protein [Vicinamibacterales bacterium]
MKTITLAVLLCFAAAPARAQETRSPEPRVPTVVTQGEAILRRAPDRAFVDLAVETRSKAPREAATRNAEIMTAVQQRLRALGLPADAVQTRGYDLAPEFDYVDGRQVLRAYTARNRIEARVDELDRLGEVIDAAIAAGATNAGAIRFDLRDRERVEREALRVAVADARGRADAAASGAGMTVARVLKIEEGGRPDVPPPMPYVTAMRAEMKQSVPTPIAAGEIEIRASVTLTAELR